MANPTDPKLAAAAATVLEIAPKLRAAGVSRFAFGDLIIDLAPPEPEPTIDTSDAPAEVEPGTGWNDPDLYGRPRGARIPGLRKTEE